MRRHGHEYVGGIIIGATIGAALKKIAVSLLLDKRNWDKIVCLILAFCVFFILPGTAVAAFFSRDDIDFSAPGLVNEVIDSLTPEQTAGLQFVEDTVNGLHAAMTGRAAEQIKAAEVLYILALSEQAKEPGFVTKLAGCFADSQTDEQLIAEVNAVCGTDLDPECFSAIMNNTFFPESMPITNWWRLPKPNSAMWAASHTGAGTASKAGWSVCARHWTSSKSPSLPAFAPRSRANSLIAIVIFNSLSAETG